MVGAIMQQGGHQENHNNKKGYCRNHVKTTKVICKYNKNLEDLETLNITGLIEGKRDKRRQPNTYLATLCEWMIGDMEGT